MKKPAKDATPKLRILWQYEEGTISYPSAWEDLPTNSKIRILAHWIKNLADELIYCEWDAHEEERELNRISNPKGNKSVN